MSEITIETMLRSGWGEYVGQYRGTWFDPPVNLPWLDANPEFAASRDRHREAFAIAKIICEPRNLWKQNEVDAIAHMVGQLIQAIDARRETEKTK